jgi:hypothetical protein
MRSAVHVLRHLRTACVRLRAEGVAQYVQSDWAAADAGSPEGVIAHRCQELDHSAPVEYPSMEVACLRV